MDHTDIPEATLHKAFNSIVIVTKSLSDPRKMSNPGINVCLCITHWLVAVEKYF